jgi:hypothetical protein
MGIMLSAARLNLRSTPVFKKISSQHDPQSVKINIAM